MKAAAAPGAPLASKFPQARAQRTHDALVTAAAELFAAHGYDAVGSPEIARHASTAVGTFYRYFGDKKQILLEVLRGYLDQLMHATLDGLSPAVLAGKARHETIELTIDVLFSSVMARPGLWRALDEMALRDGDVAALRYQFEHAARQLLTQLVMAVSPPGRVGDAEATAWMLHASAVACAAGVGGLRGAGAPSQARLRTALTTMVERVLFADAAT